MLLLPCNVELGCFCFHYWGYLASASVKSQPAPALQIRISPVLLLSLDLFPSFSLFGLFSFAAHAQSHAHIRFCCVQCNIILALFCALVDVKNSVRKAHPLMHLSRSKSMQSCAHSCIVVVRLKAVMQAFTQWTTII